MSLNLNPQGINGPAWSGNAQQSDYRVPTANANVASYATGANSQNLSWPIAQYVQPKSTKDLPNGYQTPSGQ
jgi:hypothetical protein